MSKKQGLPKNLIEQRISDSAERHYNDLEKLGQRAKQEKPTDKELLEKLGELKDLTLIQVEKLLGDDIVYIKGSIKVLTEIAKVNTQLLTALGYKKVMSGREIIGAKKI
ncbi:MAG: hypothetical protein PHN31_05925 [Candidatus Gracilibacteria bacterium]|nr:hypothetical protein [Candidatus Gracilibacteria bacterium]